jgi:hypothetical protein
MPHTARVLQTSGDVAVEHAGVRAPAAVDAVLAADDVVHVADGASVVLVTSNGWVVKLDDACDKQVGTLPLFAKDATTESVASQLAHLGAADTRAVLPEELQAGERIAGVQQHDSAATTVAATSTPSAAPAPAAERAANAAANEAAQKATNAPAAVAALERARDEHAAPPPPSAQKDSGLAGIGTVGGGGGAAFDTGSTGSGPSSSSESKSDATIVLEGSEGADRNADDARVIARRQAGFRACYERALQANPALQGRLTLRFTIAATGSVTKVDVVEDTIGSPDVAACSIALAKRLRFSAGDVERHLSQRFLFSR